jgi:hypothetical protein|nr:MAG TPA: hypothetical protein [Caudoviricetes sp.]
MLYKKMPDWLKKAKEKQEKEVKKSSLEKLKNRLEVKSTSSCSPAEIMDIWEEVERLNLREFEELKNSLTEKAKEFLENIIL